MHDLLVQLEAILFVAGEPISLAQLAAACEVTSPEALHALNHLQRHLGGRGISLTNQGDLWQLVSAPAAAEAVERFVGQTSGRLELSRPALEALAIVAYRGPITKSEIDSIRGVASDQVLRNLLGRGLVVEDGKRSAGKSAAYVVSHELLAHWGVGHTGELPSIESLA